MPPEEVYDARACHTRRDGARSPAPGGGRCRLRRFMMPGRAILVETGPGRLLLEGVDVV